jgi:hypothetical protein
LVGILCSVSLQLDKTSYCNFDYLKTQYFQFTFWDKLSFCCELFYSLFPSFFGFIIFFLVSLDLLYVCLVVFCNISSLS